MSRRNCSCRREPALPSGGRLAVADLVTDPKGWMIAHLFDAFGEWVLSGLAFFLGGALELLVDASRPDLAALWFSGPGSPFAVVRQISSVLLVAFVFLGIVWGLLAGDPGGMLRRMAVGLPAAVGGMVVLVAVVDHLLALTDALAAAVLGPTSDSARLLVTIVSQAAHLPGFAATALGLVGTLAALALWVELLVRSALVYLLVAMAPLALAASMWPAAKGVARRLLELLVAVILSKLVVAVALAVGVAATAGTVETGQSPGEALGALVVGVAVLCLAAFAPFLVLRLIPVVESAVVAHGLSRAPFRTAQGAAGTVLTVSSISRLARGAAPAAAARPPAGPTRA